MLTSIKPGKRVHRWTLILWHRRGLFEAVVRVVGKRRFWLIRGRELQKLLDGKPAPVVESPPGPVRSPARRARDQAEARRRGTRFYPELAEMGS